MPQVTDPRLTATARLLAALNQQPLRQIEQRRPPVIINPGQPQRALGLLQPSVEQIRTPLPQVQGGLLQPRGGGQAGPQPEAPRLIDQAVGLAGKLGLNKLVSEGLGTLAEQLGLSDIGSSIASSLGFGGASGGTVGGSLASGGGAALGLEFGPSIASSFGPVLSGGFAGLGGSAAGALGGTVGGSLASGGGAALGLEFGPSIASSFGPALSGGFAGLGGSTAGAAGAGTGAAAAAAPAGAALLPLLPLAAAAIPLAINLTKGSPPSFKAIVSIDPKSGRPRITDADAKGDLTSDDAAAFGQTAIAALDKVRRDLGGTFNKDAGDIGVFGGTGKSFSVADASGFPDTRNPNGLGGRFRSIEDAQNAFIIGALRSGVVQADQSKVDEKFRELAPVFEREQTIFEDRNKDVIGAANGFTPFTNPLSNFLEGVSMTDDIGSFLLRPTPAAQELIPNPNFTASPFSSEPAFLLAPNPFLQPPSGGFRTLPVGPLRPIINNGKRSPGFLQPNSSRPDIGAAAV